VTRMLRHLPGERKMTEFGHRVYEHRVYEHGEPLGIGQEQNA